VVEFVDEPRYCHVASVAVIEELVLVPSEERRSRCFSEEAG